MTLPGWDAVVLAGGRARRMGGVDKPMVQIGGTSMLQRAVAAAAGAGRVVVVGPHRQLTGSVRWCREQPPSGGPAAAVAAALQHITAPVVVLLAADLPFVSADHLGRLRAAVERDSDGAVAVDGEGRAQWLLSAWRAESLRGVSLGAGESLRDALGSLRWIPVNLGTDAVVDCDTDDDVRRARELALVKQPTG